MAKEHQRRVTGPTREASPSLEVCEVATEDEEAGGRADEKNDALGKRSPRQRRRGAIIAVECEHSNDAFEPSNRRSGGSARQEAEAHPSSRIIAVGVDEDEALPRAEQR